MRLLPCLDMLDLIIFCLLTSKSQNGSLSSYQKLKQELIKDKNYHDPQK
jgi:hypothetical protein